MALVLALAACGRVGFEERRQETGVIGHEAGVGIDASTILDAAIVTGDGSTPGCGYVSCMGTDVACCVANETSCVAAGTCGGAQYLCGSCPSGQVCCRVISNQFGGTFCGKPCPE